MRTARLVLFTSLVSACAGTSAEQAPPAPAADPNLAAMQQRIDELERRVDTLERERPSAQADAPVGSWSCSAKCGVRSTQTTDFRVSFEHLTGQGTTAAAAYDDLLRKCDGRLYERIEGETFVGGEMKSVCMSDAAPAAR